MKILFVISVLKQGRGGHYHSLNHISKEIGAQLEVAIVTIGTAKSSVIEANEHFLTHIPHNGINFLKLRRKLRNTLSGFGPDILHFFDVNAYNAVKPIIGKRYTLVVNLCGGPNPVDYPRVENLVLFSKENQSWFLEREKYQDVTMSLIPNRVKKIVTQPGMDIKKDDEAFCFMRIARIGTSYIKSFEDAIRLLERLKQSSKKAVKLYILGTIENREIYEVLKAKVKKDSDIRIITGAKYTVEASKMLYLADAVIATGRGIMEASSLGLPVLTPASNTEIPILITEQNFERFFGTNFSQRNKADKLDFQENLGNIERLINDQKAYNKASDTAFEFFEKNFDVSKAYVRYHELYKLAISQNKWVSRTCDLYLKLRTAYHFHLSSKK